MKTINDINYYTIKDTAEKLQVNQVTIRRWIKKGQIKFIQIGKPYFIPESEIYNLLKV